MTPLPPRDQRHLWLRYQVEGYTKNIVHTFEQRLEIIFRRRLFEIRAPLVQEFILEFFSTYRIGLHTTKEMAEDGFRAYWLGSERVIPNEGDLSILREGRAVSGYMEDILLGILLITLVWTKEAPDAAASALGAAEDSLAANKGAQANLAPEQA
ncbi:hypothetical protein Tco_1179617, partial [Tanacetum coccineum]